MTSKCHKIPEIRFEDQQTTSFSGLLIFKLLFKGIDLKLTREIQMTASPSAPRAPAKRPAARLLKNCILCVTALFKSIKTT